MTEKEPLEKVKDWVHAHKKILSYALVAFVILVFFNPITTIKVGHRGVVLSWGKVSSHVLNEGINWRTPIKDEIVQMSVQIGRFDVKAENSSKDLQIVKTQLSVNYHVLPEAVNNLYQRVGIGYENGVILPAVSEVLRAVSAKYTASELITKREIVSVNIKESLQERLKAYGIQIDETSIMDFDFSDAFNASIELKQKAEQDALKAKNDLERVKVEAEQTVTKARAESEAYRLKNQQITENIIRMVIAEKWDGKNSQVSGGSGGMMIQVKAP